MRRIILYLCLFLLLAGCEINIGGEAFFYQIEEIEVELKKDNWKEVVVKAYELKELYKKNKWKIQLLGDEDEYESLYESINKLITASQEKDQISSRMELTTIYTHIEDIYSL